MPKTCSSLARTLHQPLQPSSSHLLQVSGFPFHPCMQVTRAFVPNSDLITWLPYSKSLRGIPQPIPNSWPKQYSPTCLHSISNFFTFGHTRALTVHRPQGFKGIYCDSAHSWDILLHVCLQDAYSSSVCLLQDSPAAPMQSGHTRLCITITPSYAYTHTHTNTQIYTLLLFLLLGANGCYYCAGYISCIACSLPFDDVWNIVVHSWRNEWTNVYSFIKERKKEQTPLQSHFQPLLT